MPAVEQQLLKLDEQKLNNTYKVGVLYCKASQSTEEEMYNNEIAGPAFDEFLDVLGRKINLKDFAGYKGGLDCKTDTTGTQSVYNTFEDCEVMFHVSTLLPYTPANRQQILRKRHIGNDIVTIVFQVHTNLFIFKIASLVHIVVSSTNKSKQPLNLIALRLSLLPILSLFL